MSWQPNTGGGRATRRGGSAASGRRRSGRGREAEPDPDPEHNPDPEADPESLARTIILTKLTAQARTRHELSTALQRRNVPDDVSERVLDRMQEVGLVDDAAFAEAWVSSRQTRRQLSRTALRQELVRKGVDRDEVDQALARVSRDDEYAAALSLAEKKARQGQNLDPVVRRRRLAGALARRGFSADVTRRVLSELSSGRSSEDGADGGETAADDGED